MEARVGVVYSDIVALSGPSLRVMAKGSKGDLNVPFLCHLQRTPQ